MDAPSEVLKSKFRSILIQHIPESTVEIVLNWILTKNIQLKITNSRCSKLGDYRSPIDGKGHRISVNKDLNKYAFFITFIHEFAHLIVWEKYKNSVKPHGKEWKKEYSTIISLFLNEKVFPSEILFILNKSLNNTKSSTVSNIPLSRCLSNYDVPKNTIFIEKLPINTIFISAGGKKFRKENKLRKRFKCVCLDNNRTYSFHPLAAVVPINE